MSDTYTETKTDIAPKSMQSTLMSFVPMILIFFVFYFLIIRPQEKKRKAQQDLVNSVKKGDQVVTGSGLFGKIVKIDDNNSTVELEIAKDIIVKILKSSILNVVTKK